MSKSHLSRRDFLKLSELGLAGIFMPPLNFRLDEPFAAQQGRVTSRMAWMFDQPSDTATKIQICRRDMVIKIMNTAISDDVDARNRVWYEVATDSPRNGYVYSGNIQPVKTLLNIPSVVDVPVAGVLADVSVPYTDAHVRPETTSKAAYRWGTYSTPKASFISYHKRPSRRMAAGDRAASGFDLPGVPWVQYLTQSGISLHGTYWHSDLGRPRSHGCINLSMAAAKWLYRWSSPAVPIEKNFSYGRVGTKVEIVL